MPPGRGDRARPCRSRPRLPSVTARGRLNGGLCSHVVSQRVLERGAVSLSHLAGRRQRPSSCLLRRSPPHPWRPGSSEWTQTLGGADGSQREKGRAGKLRPRAGRRPHETRRSLPLPRVCAPQVSRESVFNKMDSSSLACVFGLNLLWPSQGAASLGALLPLHLFTELLIEHHGKVFGARDARGEPGEQGGPQAGGPAAPPSPGPGRATPRVLEMSR